MVDNYSTFSQEVDPLTNKTPVELADQNDMSEKTVLKLLTCCEGNVFKHSLTYIAAKTEDRRVGVLTEYLKASTQEHRLKCAVLRVPPRNSKLVTVSTAACKQSFKTSLRYLGRFELSAVPVSRNDETGVEVFRACDYVGNGTTKVDVCVKFCTELSIVEDELYARKVRRRVYWILTLLPTPPPFLTLLSLSRRCRQRCANLTETRLSLLHPHP